MDLSCGFQVSLSFGTRSRNFRVRGACNSNSDNNSLEIGTVRTSWFGKWGIGYCGESSSLLFGAFADSFVNRVPTRRHAFAMVIRDKPKAGMTELDHRFIAVMT